MEENNLRQRKTEATPDQDLNESKPSTSNAQEQDEDQAKDQGKEQDQNKEVKGPFSADDIKPEMTEKEAYFTQLRAWVHQANMAHNAMTYFPYYLMANYPQMFQMPGFSQTMNMSQSNGMPQMPQNMPFGMGVGGQQPGVAPQVIPGVVNQPQAAAGNGGERRIADYFDNDLRQEEIINQNGGYEFVISPLWKRLVAEIIDVLIVLIIKLLLAFTIVDLFDINIGIEFDFDALKKSIEDDYKEFLSLSSDLIVLEIITKIAVCIYEALWTMTGHVYVGGASPGKILMGIRIVHVEAVLPLQPVQPGINLNNGTPLRALLFPATNPGFKRAFFRAVAKNILMTLLFPMCFVMLFFKNNRTAYDIMTKTIVIEESHAPVLRRR